jgi:hypothetical protein
MELRLLRMFQDQALTQAQFVLFAAEDLAAAQDNGGDVYRIFFAIEGLLNAAANLSKTFWGAKGKLSTQRKPLRDSIGLSDSSPLQDVDMRNNFQHFDERLDRWWAESEKHNFIDMNLGDMNEGLDFPTAGDIDKFRNYTPDTGELWFWGELYDVKAIVAEVKAIVPRLEAEISKRN